MSRRMTTAKTSPHGANFSRRPLSLVLHLRRSVHGLGQDHPSIRPASTSWVEDRLRDHQMIHLLHSVPRAPIRPPHRTSMLRIRRRDHVSQPCLLSCTTRAGNRQVPGVGFRSANQPRLPATGSLAPKLTHSPCSMASAVDKFRRRAVS